MFIEFIRLPQFVITYYLYSYLIIDMCLCYFSDFCEDRNNVNFCLLPIPSP